MLSGEAVLSGEVVDQAALHGVLIKVRDLGLPLVAVRNAVPTSEDPATRTSTTG